MRSPKRTIFPLVAAVLLVCAVSATDAQEWFGFTPYPGARTLCSQSVLGQNGEEILWHSYATKDKPARVAGFYRKEKNAKTDKADDTALTLRRGDSVLDVFSPTAHYPQCDVKPDPRERTVIVVSRMLRRAK